MASMLWFNPVTEVWDCLDLSFPDTNPKIVNPAVPNDPALTGVPNDLSGPIRISID